MLLNPSRTARGIGAIVAGLIMICAAESRAVPALQLYIEGATYDTSSQTWVGDFSSGDTIRLWAIGNVAGAGGKGTIYDVKLSIAYDSADSPNVTSFLSSTTGGYGGFSDPSTPIDATYVQTVTDGSAPLMGDGSSLPSHGIYGAGTSWMEYSLGDFAVADAMGGDFISSLPSPPQPGYAINVYAITITGTDFVHFDLYDHTVSATSGQISYKFAPFSHDAEGGMLPDGGNTLALLGLGLVGVGLLIRKRETKAAL